MILRWVPKEIIMSGILLATLSNIRRLEDMVAAFRDEEHCRRLLENMVWPGGRSVPPAATDAPLR